MLCSVTQMYHAASWQSLSDCRCNDCDMLLQTCPSWVQHSQATRSSTHCPTLRRLWDRQQLVSHTKLYYGCCQQWLGRTWVQTVWITLLGFVKWPCCKHLRNTSPLKGVQENWLLNCNCYKPYVLLVTKQHCQITERNLKHSYQPGKHNLLASSWTRSVS